MKPSEIIAILSVLFNSTSMYFNILTSNHPLGLILNIIGTGFLLLMVVARKIEN